jgi:hypothetical protein
VVAEERVEGGTMTESQRWTPQGPSEVQSVFDQLGLTSHQDRELFSLLRDLGSEDEPRLVITPSLSDSSSPYYVKE